MAKTPSTKTLTISENINAPTRVISHTGPIVIAAGVTLLRLTSITAAHGHIYMNGQDGSLRLDVDTLTVNDPRDQDGTPSDGFHLGGVTGRIGMTVGTGLQQDMGKIGSGSQNLVIGHSIGTAVAMENKASFDPDHIPHQDGWQVMEAHNVTINVLDYTGGPDTQHAALFCQPQKAVPGIDQDDPTLVTDVVALGGTIYTKAQGIVLGACTRCGAQNMHITAHYPFMVDKARTVDPINANNVLVKYVDPAA